MADKIKDVMTKAFPSSVNCLTRGMSLRDWFAGMAMMGTVNHADGPDFSTAARQAYAMADEMMEARKLGQGQP